jgi:hypothetical protein
MGWSNQVVRASEVIIAGSPDALFVYDGTPGPGKLIASIAAVAGTDPYGNAYQAGITSYNGTPNYISIADSIISFSNGVLIENAGPFLNIGGTGGQAINIGLPNGSPLYAVQPGTTVTQEAWHPMTLANGWTQAAGNVTCQYRLVASPPNSVQVVGAASFAAATSATLWTAPAGYQPASQQQLACGLTAGAIAGQQGFLQVTAAGVFSLARATVPSAGGTCVFSGIYSLDS